MDHLASLSVIGHAIAWFAATPTPTPAPPSANASAAPTIGIYTAVATVLAAGIASVVLLVNGILTHRWQLKRDEQEYQRQRDRDEQAHRQQLEREQVASARARMDAKRGRLRAACLTLLIAARSYQYVPKRLAVLRPGEDKRTRDARLLREMEEANQHLWVPISTLQLDGIGSDVITLFGEVSDASTVCMEAYNINLSNAQPRSSTEQIDVAPLYAKLDAALEKLEATMRHHLDELDALD